MTAQEIRKACKDLRLTKLGHAGETLISVEERKLALLAEFTAQLAELNEQLRTRVTPL